MYGSGGGEDRNTKSDVGTCSRIWGRRSLVIKPLSLFIGLASGSWGVNGVRPGGFWCSTVDEHASSGAFSMNEPLQEELGFGVAASLALTGPLALGALGAFGAFGALGALGVFGALVALVALGAFGALGAPGAPGAPFAFLTGVGFRRGVRSSIGMTFFRILSVSIPADVGSERPEKSGSCRGGGNGERLYVKVGTATWGCIGYEG